MADIKDTMISARVPRKIKEQAEKNLSDQGISLAEFIRLSLAKASRNEIKILSYLDTPEARDAKVAAENGDVERLKEGQSFSSWLDNL